MKRAVHKQERKAPVLHYSRHTSFRKGQRSVLLAVWVFILRHNPTVLAWSRHGEHRAGGRCSAGAQGTEQRACKLLVTLFRAFSFDLLNSYSYLLCVSTDQILVLPGNRESYPMLPKYLEKLAHTSDKAFGEVLYDFAKHFFLKKGVTYQARCVA